MDVLSEYSEFISKQQMDQIYKKAERLSDKHIVCVSSTYQGGGVAEILDSMVILLNKLGIKTGWRILEGSPDFFNITKKFHDALQGEKINLSKQKKEIYYETNHRFSLFTHIEHDLVIVHDPQPLPLIDFYKRKEPWIFRCHVDLSNPNIEVWNYLKGYIEKYDHLVVSLEKYKQKLSIPQSVIYPAIDPLTSKNKPVAQKDIDKYMHKYDINTSKPVIAQISRFDKWKDPLGVLDVFELMRKKVDCQIVFLGSLAADDPEGVKIFEKVECRAQKSNYQKDIKLILMDNDFLVNCLQRVSSVIIQKSIREGFGLTVSEALFKGTPVVASNVGGIPTQIIDGYNGFLHDPKDTVGFSESILKLLKNETLRKKFGENGREYVKKNFLTTRLIDDWLILYETWLEKKATHDSKRVPLDSGTVT